MSLEAALAENTAALKEVAALLKEANEGREKAVEKLAAATSGEGSGGTGRRGRPSGSTTKPKDPEPETKPQEAPQAADAPKDPEQPAEPEDPVAAFRVSVGKWANQPEPEKSKRMEFIRAINDHLGIAKIVQADQGNYDQILNWLDRKAAGEDVNFSEGEDEVDDGIG